MRRMPTSTLLRGTLILIIAKAAAFPEYQDRIPNGNRVPHPCLDNYLWAGLGHKNAEGGGERNPFGEDFDLNGKVWDKCLCERDSDGDGRTNGEELGDPDCVWTVGELPTHLDGITHPGVCEPLNSPTCQEKNDWEFCTPEVFECDGVNQPDVRPISLVFPETEVPAVETSYYCMTFDLPIGENETVHLIASEPLLDNTRVAHHILVYGCHEQEDDSWKTPEPTLCGMDAQYCTSIVGLWAVGNSGICFPEEYGFRLGVGGFRTVMMQIHWNNPELRSDQTDGSGITLHVTNNIRPNDAGVLQIGTQEIFIPPLYDSYSTSGVCRPECTQSLPQSIHMDIVILHMHYQGEETGFTHTRDGVLQHTIYEPYYSYDNPKLYSFDQPAELRSGDTLGISCTFQTSSKLSVTKYGDGTQDEMCFGFIIYYPYTPLMTYCTSFKSLRFCTEYAMDPFPGCDIDQFLNDTALHEALYYALSVTCDLPGASPEACPEGCAELVEDIRANNTCLQGDTGLYVETMIISYYNPLGDDLVRMLHTCDPDWDQEHNMPKPDPDRSTQNSTDPIVPEKPEDETCVFSEEPGIGSGSRPTAGMALLMMLVLLVGYQPF